MMTSEQIKLVQKSWQLVTQSSDKIPPLFYSKLFELDPKLESIFKSNMTEQYKKFMSMLNIVINGLDNLDLILKPVQQLGINHMKYGVKDEYYDTVAEALIYALDATLNNAFTDAVRTAWIAAYTTLSTIMKEAAAEAQ